jgi:hypothetical protein
MAELTYGDEARAELLAERLFFRHFIGLRRSRFAS